MKVKAKCYCTVFKVQLKKESIVKEGKDCKKSFPYYLILGAVGNVSVLSAKCPETYYRILDLTVLPRITVWKAHRGDYLNSG